MNIYSIKHNEIPKCKYCNKPMKEWNFWQTKDFAHTECISNYISDSLLKIVEDSLKTKGLKTLQIGFIFFSILIYF